MGSDGTGCFPGNVGEPSWVLADRITTLETTKRALEQRIGILEDTVVALTDRNRELARERDGWFQQAIS